MRIGEAARVIGVEPHVLRHWEDVGVVRPPRTVSGYREYDEETLTRLRIVVGCREAGLSLEQTRLAIHRDARGREAVVREQLDRVDQQLESLRRTRAFLEHVVTCRHSLVTRCPGCSAFARASD